MKSAAIPLVLFTVVIFYGCSDAQFTETEKNKSDRDTQNVTAQKRTTKEKPEKANRAVEPSVIIGAYLTCRETQQMNQEQLSFGCTMHAQNGQKLEAPTGSRFDFAATDSNKNLVPPIQQPLSSLFHVLFNIPKSNAFDLVFGANIASQADPIIFTSPKSMTYQVASPSAPTFNRLSAQVQRGTALWPTNTPADHTVHWTYTNDLSSDLAPPTCRSSAVFGSKFEGVSMFGAISLDSDIKIKAITCNTSGLPSAVTELTFTVPPARRGGSCGC